MLRDKQYSVSPVLFPASFQLFALPVQTLSVASLLLMDTADNSKEFR